MRRMQRIAIYDINSISCKTVGSSDSGRQYKGNEYVQQYIFNFCVYESMSCDIKMKIAVTFHHDDDDGARGRYTYLCVNQIH